LRANRSSFRTWVPIRPSAPQNDAPPFVAPPPKGGAHQTMRPLAVSHSLWTSLRSAHRGATPFTPTPVGLGVSPPRDMQTGCPAFLPPKRSSAVGRRSTRPVCSTLPRRTSQGDCGSLPLSAGYPTFRRTRHNQNLLGPDITRRPCPATSTVPDCLTSAW